MSGHNRSIVVICCLIASRICDYDWSINGKFSMNYFLQLSAVERSLKQLMTKSELRVIDYYFFSGLSAAPSTINSSSDVTPKALQIGTIASIDGRRSGLK